MAKIVLTDGTSPTPLNYPALVQALTWFSGNSSAVHPGGDNRLNFAQATHGRGSLNFRLRERLRPHPVYPVLARLNDVNVYHLTNLTDETRVFFVGANAVADVDKIYAAPGETVTITVTRPNLGLNINYTLLARAIYSNDDPRAWEEIPLTDSGNDIWTFTMPGSAVHISVTSRSAWSGGGSSFSGGGGCSTFGFSALILLAAAGLFLRKRR